MNDSNASTDRRDLVSSDSLGQDGRVLGRSRFKLDKDGQKCRKYRQGAAVVEFALVAPIFFLLVFGMIEWGRMVMVQQVLTNASREGARKAVLEGISTADVQTAVNDYLTNAGITAPSVGVTVTSSSPVPPDYANSMTVNVTVPFSEVSWLPTPMSLSKWVSNSVDLNTMTLSASTTMRQETIR